jgi:PemK-like, MazF-like toxin of type II toxin-antitoxin system
VSGEIFICRFPFTSGAFSKPRPVLVLFDLQQDVLICRITSATRSEALDVPISDWKQAGLAKPSVARLDRWSRQKDHPGSAAWYLKRNGSGNHSQSLEPAYATLRELGIGAVALQYSRQFARFAGRRRAGATGAHSYISVLSVQSAVAWFSQEIGVH